jgi:hypothetical protein
MEIREIVVPEINASIDLPQVAIPQAPPVTLEIGVPVIELPHFSPMDMEPEVQPPKVVPPKLKPADPPAAELPPIKLPKEEQPAATAPAPTEQPPVETKPLTQRIVEAIPTIPQAVNTAGTSAIAVSAALATPLLLKAIRPTIKKLAKKLQQTIGKKVKVESVSERRKFQRSLRK